MVTQSPHPMYTLFRVPEEGMVEMEYQDETVEMEYQDETVEMESQEEKERGETLVCRDNLDHKDLRDLQATLQLPVMKTNKPSCTQMHVIVCGR